MSQSDGWPMNFAWDIALTQIRKYLHRCRQRIALTRCQQIERAPTLSLQFWKQPFEESLRSSCTHIDQTEIGRTVVAIVIAFQVIHHADTLQKLLCDGAHRPLIMQLRCQCIDSYHIVYSFSQIQLQSYKIIWKETSVLSFFSPYFNS